MDRRDKLARSEIIQEVVRGGVSGLLATLPMTAFMLVSKQYLPPQDRYALPPREITHNLAKKSGQEQAVDTPQESDMATGLSHFGYGALAGSLYALLTRRVQAPSILKGSVFGLLLWGGSYLGWLPALGVLSPATEHPKSRVALMIGAHLIFGPATALVYQALKQD